MVLAALWKRLPIVVMEPNAMPGLTNRQIGRFVARALVNFPEAARFFPAGKSEVTGLPVRAEFFRIQPKPREAKLTVLITGGSQGSRTLNEAAAGSWRYFREAAFPVRFIHQTGSPAYEALARKFAESRMEGEIAPFIDNMPAAFAQADVVVCRAGAGTVAELAAAGKPSILVPLPHAADEHQLRNAGVVRAGRRGAIGSGSRHGRRPAVRRNRQTAVAAAAARRDGRARADVRASGRRPSRG